MKLTKKHAVYLLTSIIITVSVFMFYIMIPQGKNGPLQFYEDTACTRRINSFLEPGVFHDFNLGWNNKTFWIKNVGDNMVEIGMIVTALPKGWFITWSYDGEPICSQETVKVTVGIYVAYQISTKLFLGINFKYRVVGT